MSAPTLTVPDGFTIGPTANATMPAMSGIYVQFEDVAPADFHDSLAVALAGSGIEHLTIIDEGDGHNPSEIWIIVQNSDVRCGRNGDPGPAGGWNYAATLAATEALCGALEEDDPIVEIAEVSARHGFKWWSSWTGVERTGANNSNTVHTVLFGPLSVTVSGPFGPIALTGQEAVFVWNADDCGIPEDRPDPTESHLCDHDQEAVVASLLNQGVMSLDEQGRIFLSQGFSVEAL